MNLKSKFAFKFSILIVTILILFSIIVYLFFSSALQQDFNYHLKSRAVLVTELWSNDQGDEIIPDLNIELLEQENIRIFNENNKQIYHSSGSQPAEISFDFLNEVRNKGEACISTDRNKLLGIAHDVNGKEYIIVVSGKDTEGANIMSNLRLILFFGVLGGGIISFLFSYLYSRQVLMPVIKIIGQVKENSGSSVNFRLMNSYETPEIEKLSSAFNDIFERLENNIELQKILIYNISHGLRTPFSLILGEIEIALMKQRSHEDYVKVLNSISEEIKNLNKLSDKLLEFSQISLDAVEINYTPLRVDELLYQARIELLDEMPKYKVTFEDFNLPEEEEALTISGDESLMKKVFVNIMDNACKYSSSHEVFLKLCISEKSVCVEFSDNGIGILQDEQYKIFEPFFRGSNFAGKQGQGLGLTIAKKIVELHNGTIEVASVLGKGSKFAVTIPIGASS